MRLAALAVAVVLAVALAFGARAQAAPPRAAVPPGDAVEAAKAHFAAGSAYYEQGNWSDAAKEFKEAYRLSRRVDLLYNISMCEERLGNLDAAVNALRAYLATNPADRATIESRIARLEQKRREAPPPSAIPVPVPVPVPLPVPERIEATVASTPPPVAAPSSDRPARWWAPGTAIGVIGAAALVAALGTGLSALRTADDLDHFCVDKICPPDQRARVSRGEALAISTDVLIGVGAAAVITSAILLGVQSRRRPASSTAALRAQAAQLSIQF